MLNVVVTGTRPLFTLAEAKAQLGVEHNSDDALIGLYMDGAVAAILQYCNLTLVPDGDVPEAAFKVAGLMMVSLFYARRGDDAQFGDLKLPGPVRLLVDPYRWLRV